jgi:hypothetical protein
VLIIVGVNLRVAVEADGNCVLDIVAAIRVHVVGLDLDTAEPSADAAPAAALRQKLGHLHAVKGHMS